MKKYFFIAMAMLCHAAMAQDANPPTIYFIEGKTLSASKIRLRLDAFNDYYLLADGNRIPASDVRFFQNDRGFFANTQALQLFRQSQFAERIEQGNINLYREVPKNYDTYGYRNHYREHGETPYGLDLYYNKGLEKVKQLTYNNLLADLKDNQQSLDFLAAYRKKRRNANVFIGLAGAALVASTVTFFNQGKTEPLRFGSSNNFKIPYLSYGLMGAGAALGVAGMVNYFKSRSELTNAIDAYNH